MIRRHLLLEKRIRLHAHEVLDIAECGLNDAIVVCSAIELRAHDLIPQEASLGCVVCLRILLIA
jgi:hypothetical protein